ncbi:MULTISPECIES: hypothetical protein [Mycobacteriaceae]|uniref:Polyketide cyclase n=1 Tax=Mycolicibacterium nivoides TaxID=2487344 RepID=A0ABW9LJ56_9MYCO|nr:MULTISPECIES: hypothetical protein [Mycobacteriaceae]
MNTSGSVDRFERRVTLHRFIGAKDAEAARRASTYGVRLCTGPIHGLDAVIEDAGLAGTRAAIYRHHGEQPLWWVSTDIVATIIAADERSATEAAYLLVSVNATDADGDVFRYEVQVLGDTASHSQRAAA